LGEVQEVNGHQTFVYRENPLGYQDGVLARQQAEQALHSHLRRYERLRRPGEDDIRFALRLLHMYGEAVKALVPSLVGTWASIQPTVGTLADLARLLDVDPQPMADGGGTPP
jgi:hypothetical protein